MTKKQTSNALTAILVDDEEFAAKSLALQLGLYCPEVSVLSISNDPEAAVLLIQEHKPDVVFLDIEMPGMSGLDLLQKFPSPFFEVIFVTAYQEYAIQALRLKALDYLLKPVKEAELKMAVQEALTRKTAGKYLSTAREQVTEALEQLIREPIDAPQTIWLKTSKGFKVCFQIADLVWFKSDGDYAKMYWLKDGKTQETWVDTSLKNLEEKLGGLGFFRAHDGHIINLRQITGYHKGQSTIRMKDDTDLPVARRRKDELEALLEKI